MYSDAGDGLGAFRLDQFSMMRQKDDLKISWQETGTYPFPYTNVQIYLHGEKLKQAWIDNLEVAVEGQKLDCTRFSQLRRQLIPSSKHQIF